MEAGIGPAARKPATDVTPVLPPSPAEAAAAVKAVEGPKNDDRSAAGIPAEHEFDLSYTDARGFLWAGHFKCHVLSIKERAAVGLTRARMCGGLSPAQVDDITLQLLEMQAWLALALDDAPPWVKKLGEFRDSSVLGKIYEEVLAHEDRFWEPVSAKPDPSKSAEHPAPA